MFVCWRSFFYICQRCPPEMKHLHGGTGLILGFGLWISLALPGEEKAGLGTFVDVWFGSWGLSQRSFLAVRLTEVDRAPRVFFVRKVERRRGKHYHSCVWFIKLSFGPSNISDWHMTDSWHWRKTEGEGTLSTWLIMQTELITRLNQQEETRTNAESEDSFNSNQIHQL